MKDALIWALTVLAIVYLFAEAVKGASWYVYALAGIAAAIVADKVVAKWGRNARR